MARKVCNKGGSKRRKFITKQSFMETRKTLNELANKAKNDVW